MKAVPPLTDPAWEELPDGVGLITDGDEVAGFKLDEETGFDLEEMNEFLPKVGLPQIYPPE